MDYCIVYLSSSSGLLTDDELAQILKRSQKNNLAQGITGILLYFNGCIIQVLEGAEECVKALYAGISHDSRHIQVTKLYSGPIEQRSFPAWSMGYKTLTSNELVHLQDIFSFTNDLTLTTAPKPNIILSLVRTFYLNNHRN